MQRPYLSVDGVNSLQDNWQRLLHSIGDLWAFLCDAVGFQVCTEWCRKYSVIQLACKLNEWLPWICEYPWMHNRGMLFVSRTGGREFHKWSRCLATLPKKNFPRPKATKHQTFAAVCRRIAQTAILAAVTAYRGRPRACPATCCGGLRCQQERTVLQRSMLVTWPFGGSSMGSTWGRHSSVTTWQFFTMIGFSWLMVRVKYDGAAC